MEFNAYDIDITTFEFQGNEILIDRDGSPWELYNFFGNIAIRSTWSVLSMNDKEDEADKAKLGSGGWLSIDYFRMRCAQYGPWKIVYRKPS